jgi:hypothetical protein
VRRARDRTRIGVEALEHRCEYRVSFVDGVLEEDVRRDVPVAVVTPSMPLNSGGGDARSGSSTGC